jgi:hypothetical protein
MRGTRDKHTGEFSDKALGWIEDAAAEVLYEAEQTRSGCRGFVNGGTKSVRGY